MLKGEEVLLKEVRKLINYLFSEKCFSFSCHPMATISSSLSSANTAKLNSSANRQTGVEAEQGICNCLPWWRSKDTFALFFYPMRRTLFVPFLECYYYCHCWARGAKQNQGNSYVERYMWCSNIILPLPSKYMITSSTSSCSIAASMLNSMACLLHRTNTNT